VSGGWSTQPTGQLRTSVSWRCVASPSSSRSGRGSAMTFCALGDRRQRDVRGCQAGPRAARAARRQPRQASVESLAASPRRARAVHCDRSRRGQRRAADSSTRIGLTQPSRRSKCRACSTTVACEQTARPCGRSRSRSWRNQKRIYTLRPRSTSLHSSKRRADKSQAHCHTTGSP
jgi:hypothetical protein